MKVNMNELIILKLAMVVCELLAIGGLFFLLSGLFGCKVNAGTAKEPRAIFDIKLGLGIFIVFSAITIYLWALG